MRVTPVANNSISVECANGDSYHISDQEELGLKIRPSPSRHELRIRDQADSTIYIEQVIK